MSIKEPVLYCCAGLVEGPDEVFAMVSAVVMQDIGTGGDSCAMLHVGAGAVDKCPDVLECLAVGRVLLCSAGDVDRRGVRHDRAPPLVPVLGEVLGAATVHAGADPSRLVDGDVLADPQLAGAGLAFRAGD